MLIYIYISKLRMHHNLISGCENAYNYIDDLGLGMLLLKSFGRRDWNHGLKCFQDPCDRESRIRTMKRTTGNLIIHSDIVNQNNHTGKIDR